MSHFTRPISIAYAEDHTIVRKGIIALLEADPEIVISIEAADGARLIEQLKTAEPLPDICLIDIQMPRMDGFECILAIKEQWPDMKILVLTAFEDEVYILKMIRAGANGFLLKGCDVAEIKNALIAIDHNGYYYSGGFNKRIINAVDDGLLKIPVLTPKEQEVLNRSTSDLLYAEIAREMGLTVRSVQGIRDSLFKKLEVHNRASLVFKAIKMGLLVIQPDKI